MPCPFCDDVVLVSDALPSLFIHPAPTTKNKGYTPVTHREVIYPRCLVKPVWTVCMAIFRRSKLIMLFKMDNHLAALKPLPLFLAYGTLFYTDYIEIIKNTGWEHQAYQLLKNR